MSDLFEKEAKSYRSREKIKSAKYQEGMEDGYILRFYKRNCMMLSGAIICTTLEQAEEESKKPTREKICLGADNQHIPVVYEKPVPIIINHKYTDEEYKEFLAEDLIPFTPFIDDTENEYAFAEITEEDCWIIKNLIDGSYYTASEEFMKEYELLVQGTEENMYNPCATCYAHFSKSYTEDCDNKCGYANILKRINVFLEKTIKERDKAIELSKSAIEQLKSEREENMEAVKDLRKEIQRNHDLLAEFEDRKEVE